MTVEEMIQRQLDATGHDGLFNTDLECACLRDDLAPCEEIQLSCEAGYRTTCPGETCNEFDGGNHRFHVTREKRR